MKVNSSDLLKEIEKFGWTRPLYVEELAQDIQKSSELFKQKDLEAFLTECEKLKIRWRGCAKVR